MTVGELITLLQKEPKWAPVRAYTADGVEERITAIDTNEDDTPWIQPLVIFICSERLTRPT